MSKKARRRPSWGKYRQKYGMVVEYYQPTQCIYGEDALVEIGYIIKRMELNTKTREADPDLWNKIVWKD